MASSHLVTFHTAVLSEPGGRENNEDWCGWRNIGQNTCWVVADGLGGHNGGELAAKTAATAILDSFSRNPLFSSDALRQHLLEAHNTVQLLQAQDPAVADMRTTVVTLLASSQEVMWAHVGDSRLYWFRHQRLLAQTEDHSVPQILAKAGDIPADKIRGHSDRNRLLRSIGETGPLRPVPVEQAHQTEVGDAFVLCTDGFWEHVLETEMQADVAVAASASEWLKRLQSRLLKRVSGTYDNYSAIAIYLSSAPAACEDVTTELREPVADNDVLISEAV